MKNFKPFSVKILVGSLALFITTIVISCQPKQEQSTDRITQEAIDAMKNDHLISLDDAVKMYKKYDKDRVKILKDTLKKKYKNDKFEDTRMVWFDINDIKAYIKYVEDKSQEKGITPKGLQVYFSVYPNEKSKYETSKDHQTLFIAPTETSDQQSGYTLDKDGKIIYLKDKLKNDAGNLENKAQKAGFFALVQGDDDDDDGFIFNTGDLSPPN